MVEKAVNSIVKWPGGKSAEADLLLPLIPDYAGRFIDPFVGGGAILFSQMPRNAEVNDLSAELIALYRAVKKQDKTFFEFIQALENARSSLNWVNQRKNSELFLDLFRRFSRLELGKQELDFLVQDWILSHRNQLLDLIPMDIGSEIFLEEVKKNIVRKLIRVKYLQDGKNESLEIDLQPNIETAMHSAYYMYIRHLYNNSSRLRLSQAFGLATFYYLREFCYSSMFRFNKLGEFNVPYGGMAYNGKDFGKKIENIRGLRGSLSRVQLHNKDFEDFLLKIRPRSNDFVFLDPPYDTEFSDYDGNDFNRHDHERLAQVLTGLDSSFLLVIKNTPFVRNLYGAIPGVETRVFDKQYTVSFQNRNNQQTKHLVMTNYAPAFSAI